MNLTDTILANPRPVLFLDTCILLDIIRSPDRKNLSLPTITAAIALRGAVNLTPPKCVLVGSSILPKEFSDNLGATCQSLGAAVEACDAVLAIGVELGAVKHPQCKTTSIQPAITQLANDLLDRTTILNFDEECLRRAFERVREKRRPAQGGKIKDAYMLEQFLKLCSELRSAGFTERTVFCSSNTDDFAEPNKPRIHQDLAGETARVTLDYFTSLTAAVGSLRLTSAP